jgi:hypothetical protein
MTELTGLNKGEIIFYGGNMFIENIRRCADVVRSRDTPC